MPNLVLLRHGTSYTNEGRHVDREQQNFLSRAGIAGVLSEAEKFRVEMPTLHFDHAFVSPYMRALQTGLNFLSTFENKPIDLRVENDLRERTYGFTNFVNMKDLIAQYGQTAVDSWDADIYTKPSRDGETQLDVYERTMKVYNEKIIPVLQAGDTVLVVAHYYVLKAFMSHFLNGGPGSMIHYNPRNCVPYCYDIEV